MSVTSGGFPITAAQAPRYTGALPEAADLVVIGGGIIGITTAIFAARSGAKVVVLEKGLVAAEQSSRNWGWIRQQGRDPAEIPIVDEAKTLWQAFSSETNNSFGLTQSGTTYLGYGQKAIERYEAWLPHGKAHGLDSKLLGPAQIAALYPDLGDRPVGALHTAGDYRAEPWVAVPAFAQIAAAEGVQIIEHCAVRCLDITNGKVAGVLTEKGRVAAPRVVLAGGAWSSLFLRNHGVALPQLSVRSQVAATQPLADVGQCAASAKKLAFRRRADGGYTLAPNMMSELFVGPDAFRALPKFLAQLRIDPFGCMIKPYAPRDFPDAWGTTRRWTPEEETPFERMRILDPKPVPRLIAKLARDFAEMFPKLGEVKIKASWAGMIDTMPDIVPVVDHAPIEGLIVGTGMSGHGFGIGPAIGRILADLAAGRPAGHDMDRFRFSRFSDGSKMEPGPDV